MGFSLKVFTNHPDTLPCSILHVAIHAYAHMCTHMCAHMHIYKWHLKCVISSKHKLC